MQTEARPEPRRTGKYDAAFVEAKGRGTPFTVVLREHGFSESEIESATRMTGLIRRRVAQNLDDRPSWLSAKRGLLLRLRAETFARLDEGRSENPLADLRLLETIDTSVRRVRGEEERWEREEEEAAAEALRRRREECRRLNPNWQPL